MYTNFIKVAFRYLWNNKTYSLLNFLCLTFGLTCTIIALLYVLNALNYNRFNKNYDRIFSLEAYVTYFNGDRFPKENLSASLGMNLKSIPEVETVVRIASRDFDFENGNIEMHENGIYADPDFFKTFSFPFINRKSGYISEDNNSILLSEKMAQKLFGNVNCVGKPLTLKKDDKKEVFKVSGIFKNVPKQSSLQFDFIIPFSKFLTDNPWAEDIGASANQTWILLKNKMDRYVVQNKVKNLLMKHEATLNQELFLFPLNEKALYSYAGGKRVWRDMQRVVIVAAIGLAILLIACFNFINLAIALNIKRYRETGIKKVLGSGKTAIVMQFLCEAYMLTMISLIYAIMLVELLLRGFNALFDADIHLRFSDPVAVMFMAGVVLFTGLVSGLFPALYLSSSNPLYVLKGKVSTRKSYSIFRQALIVFQFAVPVVLIVCMLIIKAQDHYMRSYDIGLDKEHLFLIESTVNIQNHAENVKNELLSIPGVEAVSYSNCIPGRGTRVSNEINWEGKDASEKLHFWCITTDFDYNRTVKINLVTGRYFNPAITTDSSCYLINDVAASVMKLKNPVGQTLSVGGKKGLVIGIFKDFHALDLAGPYVPTIIQIGNFDRNTLLVRCSSARISTVADQVRKVCSKFEPDHPIQLQRYNDLPAYSNLTLPSNLVGLASFLAILLGCMGLFGLASFNAVSRTKEIGIRKVNGASSVSVMNMLLKSYAKWITIAIIIALPLAYLLSELFLSAFFFRTSIPWWAFLVSPCIVYFIALVTVSSIAYRVAAQNPVKALRYE